MRHVRRRDEHALVAGQPPRAAQVEEPLDLLVHAPDGLHASELIDRARHRERLSNGDLGDRGEERVELRRRGAVPLDARVGLLEHERRRERERLLPAIPAAEIAREDQDALRVDRPAERDLALDVEHLSPAEPDARRDSARAAERAAAEEITDNPFT